MKHKIGFNRLKRKAAHRRALLRSMATALFRYERIKTTKAKAREVRRTAEKMITRAKVDNVHNRRIIAKNIQEKDVLAKLFTDIAPRNKERPGGYTRIIRVGRRNGDAAEMVLLELVERQERERKASKKVKKEEAPKAGEVETEAEPDTEAKD